MSKRALTPQNTGKLRPEMRDQESPREGMDRRRFLRTTVSMATAFIVGPSHFLDLGITEAFRLAPRPNSSSLVVFGDSVLWGQGLLEGEKTYSLVASMLSLRGQNITLYKPVPAHSGALIPDSNTPKCTADQPPIYGEVPTDCPSILDQIDSLQGDLGAVDLILANGGLNNVGFRNIVNPNNSLQWIRDRVEKNYHPAVLQLLDKIKNKFTDNQGRFLNRNLKVVATGYYPFVSEDSDLALLTSLLILAGAIVGGLWGGVGTVVGAVAGGTVGFVSQLEKDRIVENCQTFAEESATALRQAVAAANNGLGQLEPVFYSATPVFGKKNVLLGSDPWLFGINPDLSLQDHVASQRAAVCKTYSNRTLFYCPQASIGHPNTKGAQVYAQHILAELGQNIVEFSYLFNPGSARDMVKDGAWFRDATGRYALFRGVNFAVRSKLPPYIPIMPLSITELDVNAFHQELLAVQPDLDRMKQLGFNIVRLCVMWKGLEPRPNPDLSQLLPEGRQYLTFLKEVIDALYLRGMFVLVDFHQDIAHEVYNGDGLPDWAIGVDDRHKKPASFDLKDCNWGVRYYDQDLATACFLLGNSNNTSVRHTLRSLWSNQLINTDNGLTNYPVRTHLESCIGQTAKFFKGLNSGSGYPAIIGYEAINEPHPVGLFGNDASAKQEFEQQALPQFYSNALNQIRSSDDKAFLFVEPRMDWTTYSASDPEFKCGLAFITNASDVESFLSFSASPTDRVVFSFHYYDPWALLYGLIPLPININMHSKLSYWPPIFDRLVSAATSRGMIPFLTEFGAKQDWQFTTGLNPAVYQGSGIRAYMDLQFQNIEAHLLNAIYWVYDLYNTRDGKDNWNCEDFSLLGPGRSPRNVDIVARPYPMRSSGRPVLLFFDLASKQCAIILQGPYVDEPTVIYVPRSIHYSNFFEVRASSPYVRWDEDNQLLYWKPDKALTSNVVILSPAQGFNSGVLPQQAIDLLPLAKFNNLQPHITVSSATLDFGDVGTCLRGIGFVRVQNTGVASLAINSVSTGSAGPFRVSPSNAVVAAGATLFFEVDFAPSGTGPAKDTITITSNDPTQPSITVALTGNGAALPARISATPTVLSFGRLVIGTEANGQFSVKNNGSVPLRITEVSPPSDPAFSIVQSLPTSIGCGQAATLSVHFEPSSAKAYRASIKISSSDPNQPVLELRLTGVGVKNPNPCDEWAGELADLQDKLAKATTPVAKSEIRRQIAKVQAEMARVCP